MIYINVLLLIFTLNSFLYAQWEQVQFDQGKSSSMIKYKDKIFVGGKYRGFYISEDNGESWKYSDDGLTGNTFETVSFSIFDGLYANTISGIYYFEEYNYSWDKIYDYPSNTFFKQDSIILISVYPHKFARSSDNGVTWVNENSIEFLECHTIISYKDFILRSSTTGLYRSDDLGKSWNKINDGAFLKLYLKNDTLYASQHQDLFRSFDDGKTWEKLFKSYMTAKDYVSIDNKQFVCTYQNGIFCKTNVMPRWRSAMWGIEGEDNFYTKDLFISMPYIYTITNEGVWKREISDFDLPELDIGGVDNHECIVGEEYLFQVFIGNHGYDSTRISNIELSNNDFVLGNIPKIIPPDHSWGILINLSTHDIGKYSTKLRVYSNSKRGIDEFEIEVIVNPANFYLEQNYPNPFNSGTTINYSLSKSEFVTIKLYNSLGQEVRLLESGIKSGGKHSMKLRSNRLASGFYYYQIKTENYSEIKKMVILK